MHLQLLTGAALSSAGLLGVTAVRAESARIWVRNGARGSGRGPSRRLELGTSIVALTLVSATSLAVTVVLTMMVNFQ